MFPCDPDRAAVQAGLVSTGIGPTELRPGFRQLAAARAALEAGPMHGPTRDDLPPIIAHRYWCPSCDAPAGEPCRLSLRFTQDYSHIARHRAAQRAEWQQLQREIAAGTSPIASLRFAHPHPSRKD